MNFAGPHAAVAALAAALLLVAGSPDGHAQPAAPRLLGPTVADRAFVKQGDRTIVQARVVRPDLGAVEQLARDHVMRGAVEAFVLDLFAGLDIEAEVVAAEIRADGATVFARLTGIELGSAVLTLHGGVLIGSVSVPGGEVMIERQPDGLYRVARKAAQFFPPEREPRIVRTRARVAGEGVPADVPVDAGRLIDVMIVWTPAAATAATLDGTTIQAVAQASIDNTNATFLNSGIAQRLRLVHAQQVAYAERAAGCADPFDGSMGSDAFECALFDVTGTADGHMDDVHALRSAHGADLVALLIADSTFCGIAWLPQPPSPGTADQGFAVTDQWCAVNNKSFAHELGHNMGAHHDPAVLSSGPCGDGREKGAYCYSRGFVNPAGSWRTVMAYATSCPTCGRIPFFSNPSLAFTGAALGDAAHANNAHTLNRTAQVLAGYRATSPLHPVAQRFPDVPAAHPFHGYVEFLAQSGISGGCGGGYFCPDVPVTRNQMAVFLQRGMRASGWTPPAPAGLFADVPLLDPYAPWIEALRNDGITRGCTASTFCPDSAVTRDQMAALLLRARCGVSYVPSAPPGTTFADVPSTHPFFAYIEKLHALGVTGGCALAPLRYCPAAVVTRSQMAAFVERAYPFLAPSEVCAP